MGHEIVVYRDRHAIVHDMDFWAIRHFLLTEAEAAGHSDLTAFIRGWDWIGPGVYLGVEFDSFFGGDEQREQSFVELLKATTVRIESFGDFVPLAYLDANINLPIASFTREQSTDWLIQQLVKLQDLFATTQPAI